MKSGYLVGCLAASLVGSELCESTEMQIPDTHTLSIEPRSVTTLAWNPHTHFELDTEERTTTVAPLSATGGQHLEEMFHLFIHPAGSGFRLVGNPMSPQPDGRAPQAMYGFCPNVDALVEVLTNKAELPPAQIDAVRRVAISGGVQEIGGSHSPVTRLFRRSQLEQIGMNFRPIE
jgi:hypothetical protein